MKKPTQCKCVTKIEEAALEREIEPTIKPNAVNFDNINLLNAQTFSILEFRYVKAGKPKKKKVIIGHSHCPFCGKAYPK